MVVSNHVNLPFRSNFSLIIFHCAGLHLPAIVRDNTSSKMNMPQLAQQQSVALLDGDQVRCLTLNDTGKHCDPGTPQQSQQQPELNSQAALHMMNALKANGRHHLASEC